MYNQKTNKSRPLDVAGQTAAVDLTPPSGGVLVGDLHGGVVDDRDHPGGRHELFLQSKTECPTKNTSGSKPQDPAEHPNVLRL